MTLALLLTAVTGAWAQTEITTIPNGDFETWTYDGEDMPNNWNSNATSDGDMNGIMGGKQLKRSTDVRPGSSGQYSCSIWSKSSLGVTNIGILTSGRIHFGGASPTSNANYIYSDRDGSNTKNNVTNPCAMPFTGKPTAVKVWVKYVQGGTGYGQYATAKFSATIHGDADYVAYNLAEDDNDDNKALVVASAEQEIAYNNGEWEQLTIPFNYTDNNVDPAYILINAYTNAYPGKGKDNDYLYIDDIELEYAPEPGIDVTPGETANQWTFTMPGSDVVLTPIYAKAAAFATTGTEPEVKTLLPEAAEGVIAGTDASLIAEGTGIVAFAGESTDVTQGTLMYAIGTSATQAPALTDFSATVPTAKTVADDGATVHVWYYIQGADAPEGDAATLDNTFSDTEPACLTVQVLSNKFDIQLNAANANTIDATQASKGTVTVGGTDKTATVTDGKLQGVKMGTEVKLEAKPGYKFRKVEVKKKAESIVNPAVGQIIGSDGKNYDANATLPDGVKAVAMIAYVGSETGVEGYTNGLALALSDKGSMDWTTATGASGAAATTPAAPTPMTSSWMLPSKDQWKKMIDACKNVLGTNNSYKDLRDGFSGIAGANNMQSGDYWSSTEQGSLNAWLYYFSSGIWNTRGKDSADHVRACLAF